MKEIDINYTIQPMSLSRQITAEQKIVEEKSEGSKIIQPQRRETKS